VNASNPPAEAPIPTIGKSFSRGVCDCTCAGAGDFLADSDFVVDLFFEGAINIYYITVMFVRIKRRPITGGGSRILDYSLRFVVVQSHRKDGVPRQRIVKYLGSVRASKLKVPNAKHEFMNEMQRKIRSSGFSPLEVSKLSLSLIRAVVHRGGV